MRPGATAPEGNKEVTMARSVPKEIEELRKQIEYQSYLYYVEAAPAISDLAFDRLMRQRFRRTCSTRAVTCEPNDSKGTHVIGGLL